MTDTAASRTRLLAILAADVAGYSRLMSLDDHGTVAALDASRAVFREHIAAQAGRVIDMAGDSVLAVFDTAAGAVNAAIAIQQRLMTSGDTEPEHERRMRFRIGIHLGDVIEKADGTVYGDGVNIAARLESLATPGGITISDSVRSAVKARVMAQFVDQGLQTVKNIADPVHAFRVQIGPIVTIAPSPPTLVRCARLRRPLTVAAMLALLLGLWLTADRWRVLEPVRAIWSGQPAIEQKSVAVMSFANLSDDKDNAYFADGVSDELHALLAQIPVLKVVARSSANEFKGKSVATSEVGRQLGVAYLVEGSVRRSGNTVRIAAQLTRAGDGTTVWSQSYDRELKDIFALQSEIALLIAHALQLKIEAADLNGSGTTDIEAWKMVLEADRHIWASSNLSGDVLAHLAEAEALYSEAIRRDPRFARAIAGLATCWNAKLFRARPDDPAREEPAARDRIEAKAREALAIDPRLVAARTLLSGLERNRWQLEQSVALARETVALAPNNAEAHRSLANALRANGQMSESLAAGQRAHLLDPISSEPRASNAAFLIQAGRIAEARQAVNQARLLAPDSRALLGMHAYLAALENRPEEAQRYAANQTYYGMRALAVLGETEALQKLLAERQKEPRTNFSDIYLLALLGHQDETLTALEQGVLRQSDFAVRMLYDPAWDSMRSSPRFRALLEKYKVTAAHDRAQAWRQANSPDRKMPF